RARRAPPCLRPPSPPPGLPPPPPPPRPGRRPAEHAHGALARHRDQLVAEPDLELARFELPDELLDGVRSAVGRVDVAVVELEEDPLRPLVVAGIGRGEA